METEQSSWNDPENSVLEYWCTASPLSVLGAKQQIHLITTSIFYHGYDIVTEMAQTILIAGTARFRFARKKTTHDSY